MPTPLAVTEYPLIWANRVIVALGAAVAAAWLVWWMRHRGDPLRPSPERPSHLGPEAIPACMLAHLAGALLAQGLVDAFLKRNLPAEAQTLIDRLVPTAVGSFTGGAACLGFASRGFVGGLRGFGLRGRGVRRDVTAGVIGWLAAMALCAGLLVVSERILRWIRPFQTLPDHPVLEALRMPAMPAWARVMAVISPVVIAPIAEELFFRGIVQSFLKQLLGSRWRAVFLSAGVFGAAHYGQPQVVVPMIGFGLILGGLYERRGSLVTPIAIHLLFNLRTIAWYFLLSDP